MEPFPAGAIICATMNLKWHAFCSLAGVKRKNTLFLFCLLSIIMLFMVPSCSRVKKVKDIFDKPTAREKYDRDFEKDSLSYSRWKKAFENALFDSVAISLPYTEAGRFSPDFLEVYTYNFSVNPGERLQVSVDTDSLNTLIFLDLYRQNIDSAISYEHLKSANFQAKELLTEVEEPGIYKLLIQPEIAAMTPFRLNIYKEPVYSFPVAGRGNSSVQSYWGAARDGGRRSHEGIDIFAPRGTPVVAAIEGRVSSTGNKGLGGKQVWLRDRKRGNSLYYAHLDSIVATPGMKVSPGDTLGFVGNTGNARTTAPHLHFGIYKGYRGAQNPLPYVYRTPAPESFAPSSIPDFLLATGTANLRKGPSTKSDIAIQVKARDTLKVIGETADWYHTRLGDENFYIHKSLVQPL